MSQHCQVCGGFTKTLRRGLCRVCFNSSIPPHELYDEMVMLKQATTSTSSSPRVTLPTSETREHNGNGHGTHVNGSES